MFVSNNVQKVTSKVNIFYYRNYDHIICIISLIFQTILKKLVFLASPTALAVRTGLIIAQAATITCSSTKINVLRPAQKTPMKLKIIRKFCVSSTNFIQYLFLLADVLHVIIAARLAEVRIVLNVLAVHRINSGMMVVVIKTVLHTITQITTNENV